MDFRVIDLPGLTHTHVRSYDAQGHEVADDGEWHRHASTALYVFAELLVAKGLVVGKRTAVRSPDLVVMWSELTETGQAFVKMAYDRWLKSVDDIRTTEAVMTHKLELRWQKFLKQQTGA